MNQDKDKPMMSALEASTWSYQPTSNPYVFVKDGQLYVKNVGSFSPFPYEEQE
jgi:hypothetical protein